MIDNRAVDVICYDPEYTFVRYITAKFRKEQEAPGSWPNFMRQYYDVYCLLGEPRVQAFIGTSEYQAYKDRHFRTADNATPIRENQAFLLDDPGIRGEYQKRYEDTKALYYKDQPPFAVLLERIKTNLYSNPLYQWVILGALVYNSIIIWLFYPNWKKHWVNLEKHNSKCVLPGRYRHRITDTFPIK